MKLNNFLLLFLLLLVVVAICAPDVLASESGKNLPFEDKISTLQKAMTGPVALGISVIGIISCGAVLIFGGDIQGFARSIILIVLVISVIVGATSFVKFLGYEGALVPAVPAVPAIVQIQNE